MGCNVSKDVKVEDQGNDGDNTGMSEDKAAEKIQASFRGYKARKSLKNNGVVPAAAENADKVMNSQEENSSKTNPSKTIEDELADIDLTDKDLEKAAYKIQNSYRNFSKRKQVKETVEEIAEVAEQNSQAKSEEDNIEDIDLDDPDVAKAALKIQSTFRGYKVRKEVLPEVKGEESAVVNGEE